MTGNRRRLRWGFVLPCKSSCFPWRRFIAQFLQYDMRLCVLKTISQIGQMDMGAYEKRSLPSVELQYIPPVTWHGERVNPRPFRPRLTWLSIRSVTIIMILPSLFNATLRGIKCGCRRRNKYCRETNFASGHLLMVLCPIWQGTSFLTVTVQCKKIISRIKDLFIFCQLCSKEREVLFYCLPMVLKNGGVPHQTEGVPKSV